MVRQRTAVSFDAWLMCAESSNIPELQSFVASLRSDYVAVKAALSFPEITPNVKVKSIVSSSLNAACTVGPSLICSVCASCSLDAAPFTTSDDEPFLH